MSADHYLSLGQDVHAYTAAQKRIFSPSKKNVPCHSAGASAIRKVLREQLPSLFQIASGYICIDNETPTFQDVIIYKKGLSTLYQEGDFVYLRPEEAKVVVNVLDGGFSVNQLEDWMKESAKAGHLMKEAGNAQGLVVSWIDCKEASSRMLGFDYWKKSIASRNIPSLAIWGNQHCFCKHIGMGPVLFEKQVSSYHEKDFSAGVATLISLVFYHLLEEQKTAPFRDWFPDNMWKEERLAELPIPENGYGKKVDKRSLSHSHEASLPTETGSQSGSSQAAQEFIENPNRRREKRSHKKKSARNLARSRKKQRTIPQGIPAVSQNVSSTPVHQAVLSLDPEALVQCLEIGLDFNCKNKEGNTPIHLAAEYNLVEMALTLIEFGADINGRNYVYDTPLHVAIEKGNLAIIQQLLEAGAEVEARNNRARTPLHQAAICGNGEAVILLLNHFADIHARMEKDMQPLHLACWYGQAEMVDLLIEKGADMNAVNSDGNTALHFAAFNGQVKVIKQLINYEADPSIPNHSGETYLQGINEGYSGEVIRVLE